MIVVQSAFGSCFAKCALMPSLRTFKVPFSASDITSSMVVVVVLVGAAAAGGFCGVGAVTVGVAGACEIHGAAVASDGLFVDGVEGVKVGLNDVAGGSRGVMRSNRLPP